MENGSNFMDIVNILDIAVVVIFALCIFMGARKGLIRTVFDLFSTVVSLFLASRLYPVVSVVLREKTGLFDNVKDSVVSGLNLENVVMEQSIRAQEELIQSLPLPEFLRSTLTQNNNTEVYKILNVSSIEEYIGGYIANIFINIVAAVAVFLLVMLAMKVIVMALDIVSRLPVIDKFNKTGGVIAGVFTGFIYCWIALIVYTMLFLKQGSTTMELLYASKLAMLLYENNFLIYAILRLFA